MSTPGEQLGPARGALSAVLSESFQEGGHVSAPESRHGHGARSLDDEDDAARQRFNLSDLSVLIKPCLAEFIATAVFLIMGLLSVLMSELGTLREGDVALAHGFVIFVLVSATASVSGGHLNPAVTLGVFLNGQLGLIRLVGYWIAQLLGASVGTALVLGLAGQDNMEIIGYGVHRPLTEYTENGTTQLVSNASAVGLELVATLLLILVVLRVGSSQLGPLYIGLAVAAGILAIGRLTGGSMNPARSFGPVLVSTNILGKGEFEDKSLYFDTFWRQHWIYWVGPLAGTVLASITSRYLLAENREAQQRLYVRIKIQ